MLNLACATICGVAMFDGGAKGHRWRTYGRNIFRPYIHGAAAHGGHAIITCGRLRINRARAGEKYFAPTSVLRRRVARARSQRAGDCAPIAHIGAKYFSPVHPWCVGVWRARHHNVWAIAHQRRTDGRKIFRPYKCGALLNLACATIFGAAMFDGWGIAHQWLT